MDEPDVTSARSMAASTSESFSSFLFFSLNCRLSPLHSSTTHRHTQSHAHGHPNTESPARMRCIRSALPLRNAIAKGWFCMTRPAGSFLARQAQSWDGKRRHVLSRAGPANNFSGAHSRAPVRALT